MSYQYYEGEHSGIKAWTEGVPVDDKAMEQLQQTAEMKFIYKNIAVMPDVHWGMGATIGSVIPTIGAIIPAAVGVDIGCGMEAVKTTLKAENLPDNLSGIRTAFEKAVPHGRTDNGGKNDRGAWGELPDEIASQWRHLSQDYNNITENHRGAISRNNARHLGTLGSGNHFIELCLDEEDNVWIMLHSGSRGVGNKIGTYFISEAKKDMERWFINLPNKDLAYIPEGSDLFNEYMNAVEWAQEFAQLNRTIMLKNLIMALSRELQLVYSSQSVISCHHNYVSREHHFGKNVLITRKGAVRAREGDLGIIPGSMGDRSFIVRGKGNVDSFHSCSHGAGRVMSRREARSTFSVEDHIRDTEGVECKKDESVLDETPKAYKDIDAVMKAQEDLVDIVHTLKQVVCVKG